MMHPSPSNAFDPAPRQPIQFRLSTIFVITLIVGVLAAFLNPLGPDLLMAGAVTAMASLLFALLVGAIWPPIVERLFWGIVVAAMMQAVCATVILLDRDLGIYAWPLAAGFAAVVAVGDGNRFRRMISPALMAGSIIAIYVLYVGGTAVVATPLVACAAIGGALLAILVELVGRFERARKIPPSAIGLAMVLAAIGFSSIASEVIPGW